MIVAVVTSSDLLVAFAFACPFIAIAVLLCDDIAHWFCGVSSSEIGAGEYRNEEDLPGLLPTAGLSAALTTASSVAGADTPYDWDTAA